MADNGVDLATLGVRVTQQGVAETTTSLNALTGASEKAEASTQRLTTVTAAQAAEMERKYGITAKMLGVQVEETQATVASTTATEANRAMLVAHAQAIAMDEAATRKMALAQMEAIAMNEKLGQSTAVHGLQLGRVNMELGTAIGRFTGVNSAATRFVAMLGGATAGYGIMIGISVAVVAVVKAYDALMASTRKAKEEQDKLTESLQKWYDTKRNGESGARTNDVSAVSAQLIADQKELAKASAIVASPGISQKSGFDVEFYRQRVKDLTLSIEQEKKLIAAGTDDVVNLLHQKDDREAQEYASSLAARLGADAKDRSARKDALAALAADRATLARLLTLPEPVTQDDKIKLSARIADYGRMVKELERSLKPVQPTATDKGTFSLGMHVEDTAAKLNAETKALLDENAARDKGTASLDAWKIANAGALAVADLLNKQHDVERQALERGQSLTKAQTDAFAAQIPVVREAAETHERATVSVQHHTEAVSHIQELKDRAAAIVAENDALKYGEATRQTYVIQQQYQIEVSKALREATLEDMAAHIVAAQAVRDAALAHISITDAIKAQEAATKKAAEEEQRSVTTMLKDMQRGIAGFFDNILTKGIASFSDLFSEIKNMWLKLLADMAAQDVMQKMTPALSAMMGLPMKGGASGGTDASGEAGVAGLGASMAKAAGAALGIGAVGFGVGSLLGSQTTNRALGALGGAAGGAASGAAIGAMGGPIGVVAGAFIGATAGAIGGLLGAKHSAEEAAKALLAIKMAESQIAASLADWKAQITGTAADQKAAAAADLYWKYLSIRQTIEQVEAGKKMEQQRNKDLAEADALYAQAQKGLTDSTNALTDSMLNAVNGYKYQATIFAAAGFHAAPGAPIPTPSGGSGGNSGGSNGSGNGGSSGGGGGGDLTVNLTLGDGSMLGTAVLKDFKRRAQRQTGDSTQWSQIQ